MANYKDNNSDLGNQTIEGTEPPIEVEAVLVMPESPTVTPPTAADLDAQLADIIAMPAFDGAADPIVTPVEQSAEGPVIIPAEPNADDLDAQLAALMADEPENSENTTQDAVITPPPPPDDQAIVTSPAENEPEQSAEDLDAQLAALMADDQPEAPHAELPPELREFDAKVDGILSNEENAEEKPQENEQTESQTEEAVSENNGLQADDLAQMTERLENKIDEIKAERAQDIQPNEAQPQAEKSSVDDEIASMRAMMQQAQLMMEQAQQARRDAEAQLQAVQDQIQAAKNQSQVPPSDNSATELELTRKKLQQAQEELQRAQYAEQNAPYGQSQQSSAEVERLKAELNGMRDLVNRLTYSMSQNPAQVQTPIAAIPTMTAMPPHYGYAPSADQEQYRKLEGELDRMRRDIMEKDLRDREKELDRRQKEAENTVKDIRPEMVQMSDSHDIAPLGAQPSVGGEYIPLANGVFYSTRDRQVYVMTPAQNAASSSGQRQAPVKKKTVVRRAAPKRKPLHRAHRRPPMGRGGRPTHR